ncbi:Cyclin-B1-1 [Hordeum vulgare]|nr:Cyclin-B1-1 [Hordeum vulgare]
MRNFGAQLLKNAQEKAKNPAARPALHRDHVKPVPPPPEHVIEISSDTDMENAVLFFAELALLQYGLVQSKPSTIADAAVHTARLTLKMTPLWTDTLRHHNGFTEAQLMDAAKILIGGHGMKLRFFGQETRQTSCRWLGR